MVQSEEMLQIGFVVDKPIGVRSQFGTGRVRSLRGAIVDRFRLQYEPAQLSPLISRAQEMPCPSKQRIVATF